VEFIKLSSPATGEYWEIPVLYEDDCMMAVDKPARLLTSPDRFDPRRPNLMKLVHRDVEKAAPWVRQRGLTYLANVHRLDFDTSGILLLAKDKTTLVLLANQFGANKPLKTYAALVHGTVPEATFQVDAKLAPDLFRPGLMRIDHKKGKHSKTSFTVREQYRGYAWLECQPWTGRTHQIRVHLKHVQLSIVADRLYGGHPLLLSQLKSNYRLKEGVEEKPLIGRLALHAERLSLVHPVTGGTLEIHAPWPNDLTVAVKYLRRFAG
jgi:RluA family pseudouridine synthase